MSTEVVSKQKLFISISELAKKLNCEEKKLIRMAGQGFLNVWIMAPDTYEEHFGNEKVEWPIDYTFDYHAMDSILLQDLIGKGKDSVESHTVIQIKNQLRTHRKTLFSDLLVLESDVKLFEANFFTEITVAKPNLEATVYDIAFDLSSKIVEFKGVKHTLTSPQFLCIEVLFQRYKDFKQKSVPTISMPQKEILELANLPDNICRLDQVFKSRPKAFTSLIKRYGRGIFGLNLE